LFCAVFRLALPYKAPSPRAEYESIVFFGVHLFDYNLSASIGGLATHRLSRFTLPVSRLPFFFWML